MRLVAYPLDLRFRRPFGIARWTRTEAHNLVVEVRHEDLTGRGEGAPNARYGEEQEEALRVVAELPAFRFDSPLQWLELFARLDPYFRGARAAQAALDVALHDWVGKYFGQPLFRLWGGTTPCTIPTSFTVGLDTPERMAEQAMEAADRFRVLKVKLGTPQDRAIIQAIRRITDLPLRVDANEGWHDREEALAMIRWLAERNVELVEQPLPAGRVEDMIWLKERSPLPLIADEDAHDGVDMHILARGFHGVNIKLDKCGGLTRARMLIGQARDAGLKVMLGCMVASSLSITAAAHLSFEADYADLDGHLWLTDDPFEGVTIRNGCLCLPERPGLGVIRRTPVEERGRRASV